MTKTFIARLVRKLTPPSMRPLPPVRAARVWSNREIEKFANVPYSEVINVSAWRDEDKEGRTYRDYFNRSGAYFTSNYNGWRGTEGKTDFELDLEAEIPSELKGCFQLVFNHTTLEHIFDLHQALRGMCEMSSDALLLVVPFIQELHGPADGDFWRPSPYAMRRLLGLNGLTVLYENAGPVGGRIRYLIYFAAKHPEKWRGRIPEGMERADAILRAE